MVILYDLFIPRQAWKIGFIVFSLLQKAEQRGQSHAAASGWAQGTHSEHAFIPEPRAALADGYAILDLKHSNWNFVWMESRNC